MSQVKKELQVSKPLRSAGPDNTFHIARFNSTKHIDLTKWEVPVAMYKEPEEKLDEEEARPVFKRKHKRARAYEERANLFPDAWIIEDSTGGHVFRGKLEAQPYQYAVLIEQDNCFRVHMVDDWSVFRPCVRSSVLSTEEAEHKMNQPKKELKTIKEQEDEKQEKKNSRKKKAPVEEKEKEDMDFEWGASDDEGQDYDVPTEQKKKKKSSEEKELEELIKREQGEDSDEEEDSSPTRKPKPKEKEKKPIVRTLVKQEDKEPSLSATTNPDKKRSHEDAFTEANEPPKKRKEPEVSEEAIVTLLRDHPRMIWGDFRRIYKKKLKDDAEKPKLLAILTKVAARTQDGKNIHLVLKPDYQ